MMEARCLLIYLLGAFNISLDVVRYCNGWKIFYQVNRSVRECNTLAQVQTIFYLDRIVRIYY